MPEGVDKSGPLAPSDGASSAPAALTCASRANARSSNNAQTMNDSSDWAMLFWAMLRARAGVNESSSCVHNLAVTGRKMT